MNSAAQWIPEDQDRVDWRGVLNGLLAILRISVRRLVFSKFLIANLILAGLPVLIGAIILYATFHGKAASLQDMHAIFEGMLRILFLHFIIFFIANICGFAVMRQELDDRTLHYLFLQPVRRWVLIGGKLIAFLLISSILCVGSLWLTFFIMTVPRFGVGEVMADLFVHKRFIILVKESLVIILGLLAYGSIAMLMGSLFKSGAYGLILLGWEAGLPYLPSSIKLWTVMHYLQSMLPERLTEQRRLFELLGDPASLPLSLGVIGGVSILFIGVCMLIFQFRECMYTEV